MARYAVLVACCDSADFGPHHILTEKQRLPPYRITDEIAFSLAKYIYALEPPKNPNANDPRAAAGKKVFDREGCGGCHPAPALLEQQADAGERLDASEGSSLPRGHAAVFGRNRTRGRAETRKGTGLYKVPSLKGLVVSQPAVA